MSGDEVTLRVSTLLHMVERMDFEDLADTLDVVIVERAMPDDLYGYWDHERREIVLNERMGPAERRSTLAHELGHAILGHEGHTPKHERQAVDWAVRQLIPISVLAACFRERPNDAAYAAAVMECQTQDVIDRVDLMTENERYEMLGRLHHTPPELGS